MVQMLQSGDWSSQAVPGSTQQTIKSPYGTVSANVMSGADYDKAVANGTIPNGGVVFQTEHGWSWNQGSSGNDMGILRNGKVFNYTQNNTPNVYANVKQVVILLPKSASDVDIASRALEFGLAPRPMSAWYMQPPRQQGLLLCVTNLNERRLPADCRRLLELAR